jgi:hypothetical protein
MSFARSLTKESGNIEVTPNTPRQIPLAEQTSQLIPKEPSLPFGIRVIDTSKSPSEMILNIYKGDSQREFPHTLVDLLHHPPIPHNQNTT